MRFRSYVHTKVSSGGFLYRNVADQWKGCEERFRSGRQLASHFDQEHKKDKLLPLPEPFSPRNLTAPGPLPETVPSDALSHLQLIPYPIKSQWHKELGPWVCLTS
jgi:hypothetical protein